MKNQILAILPAQLVSVRLNNVGGAQITLADGFTHMVKDSPQYIKEQYLARIHIQGASYHKSGRSQR